MMFRRKVMIYAGITSLLFLLTMVLMGIKQSAPPRKSVSIPSGDYAYTVDYAEYMIRKLMKQHHLPSVAVALIDDQHTVWQEAFGLVDIEKEIPATTSTMYKMWSVAKVFTAIEIMRLVEEGLVDLDAPLTRYLPDFTIQTRFQDAKPITIRSILSHQAGLPRNRCYWLVSQPGDKDLLKEITDSVKYCHTTFPVGGRYKYTNLGPDVLGYLIEQTRGESFAHYMQKNLLAPIGMESSAFLAADIPAQREIALGYAYDKGDYYPLQQDDIPSLPSGNLYSTLEDMSHFVKFMFSGGEYEGEQIIKPETLQLMFEDQFPNSSDPQPMGLGWKTARVLGSELLVWHDGGPGEGIGSLVAMLPQRKLGVILFANEASFEGSISIFLAVDIFAQMLEAKYAIVPPVEATPEPRQLPPSVLDEYAGRYIGYGQAVDVTTQDAMLKVGLRGIKLGLVPIDENRFILPKWLLNLELSSFLPLPMDLRQVEIIFLPGDEDVDDVMVINFGGISYEVCPRYPDVVDIPALWQEFVGRYDLSVRLPSGDYASDIFGKDEIIIQDGVLMMPGVIGPILPINETDIIILSGPFAGETMVYDPESGIITHQWVVYRPSPISP